MRKYNELSRIEKLRLLYAKLLIQKTEDVSIEQLEKDLDMTDINNESYKYEIPEAFEAGDCLLFRYDSNQVSDLDINPIVQAMSEYNPDLNIIFVDKNLPFRTHIIEQEDFDQLLGIINKYYNLEEADDEEDDEDDFDMVDEDRDDPDDYDEFL